MSLLATLVALDASAQVASLRFALHGEVQAARSLDELVRVVAPVEARVHEPYEAGPAVFEGLPFAAVLDAVYGPSWRAEEEILFTCSDGYQPTLPVERVLAHRAWLAFRRLDRAGFTISKFESGEQREIDVAPFYLVWDSLANEAVRIDGDYGWPYQLVGIDLIRVADRFPKMVPPAPSSDAVGRGFTAFRMYCSRCHAINGEGGRIGPDLNAPVNPTEHRERAWVEAWIDDPTRVDPATRMPRLDPALPDRAAVIAEIVTYLAAMPETRAPARASPAAAE